MAATMVNTARNYRVFGLCPSFAAIRTTEHNVRFEFFTAVTMKNGVFWDVMSCGSCKNRHFGERRASLIMVTRIGELGTTLSVTANVVPSSPILSFR
jgi:hypothetical protein